MKNKLSILILFTSMISLAQNEFKTEKIKVKTDINIDSNKLSINFSQGIWNVKLYPIFGNNQIVENSFPKEMGIYNLAITYSDELFYIETVIYKNKPKYEEIKFEFYKENERIFCKINSLQIPELNKEIVMNKLEGELKDIINLIKK